MRQEPWLDEALNAAQVAAHPSGRVRLDLARILEKARALEPPTLSEVAWLLADPDGDPKASGARDEALFSTAHAIREKVFGRRVGLFAPLYYSNVCANDCVYCGFRSSLGGTKRRILTLEEVGDEAAALLEQGHRRILLIASEDPTPKGLTLALDAVAAIRKAAREADGASTEGAKISLALEMAPRAPEDLAMLAEAGVSTYVLFQETYDPALYPLVHPVGPKADFNNRLEGPERAWRAGIQNLGLGVLLGLGDPIQDAVALVAHARHLGEVTGRPVASISVPRLEPAEDVPFTLRPPHPVDDRLWLRIVAVLRLALPESNLVVSTREGIPLRRASLRSGVTVLSAGSRTSPGGYRHPHEARGQFLVGDQRSLPEVIDDLRQCGYEPSVEIAAGAAMDTLGTGV